MRRRYFFHALAATLCVCGLPLDAAIVPNPGGSVVVTNSTSATISYMDTPVTNRVDNYSTTVTAFLNGSQVFSQTYAAAFGSPTLMAAVMQANSILTGDNATFGGPQLIFNNSMLVSSILTPPPTFTCLTVPSTFVTGATSTTTVNTFGPATIPVQDCQQDTFLVLSGQLDINVNTDIVYSVPRNIVTTNTFLTTQTYDILGTTTTTSESPEPATWTLLAAGLALIALRRRRIPFARDWLAPPAGRRDSSRLGI